MVSIKLVYDTLKSLANKEQRGFLTPSSFNAFAQAAQMNVFNDIMNLSKDAKALQRVDVHGPTSLKSKARISEAFYRKGATITLNQGVGTVPSDFCKPLSASVATGSANQNKTGTNTPASFLFDRQKLEYLNNSTYLGGPSSTNPVVYISDSELICLPTDTSSVFLNYLRLPGSFTYEGNKSFNPPSLSFVSDSVTVSGSGIVEYFVNEEGSLNFDLPEQFLPDVVNEMAKMIGIQLEEPAVFQYGNNENVAREQPNVK